MPTQYFALARFVIKTKSRCNDALKAAIPDVHPPNARSLRLARNLRRPSTRWHSQTGVGSTHVGAVMFSKARALSMKTHTEASCPGMSRES